MRALLVTCVCAFSLAMNTGCSQVPIGPDVEYFDIAYHHRSAALKSDLVEWSDAPQLSVTKGTHTILVSSHGNYYGKHSSAHGGHFTFYFVLPEKLETGRAYTVSQDDGSLQLSAFGGYSWWYLDRDLPAEGTVTPRTITMNTIVADIDIRGTAVYDDRRVEPHARRREPVERAGTFEFEHRSLPKTEESR